MALMTVIEKAEKPVAVQSEIGNLRRLQLKLQFVSDQSDEFGIGGFSLGIADGIAEESLQSVQIASVPSHFNGMTDGSFHSAGGGLEGFCHLGVEYLGDGIGVPYGPPRGFQKGMIWRGICEGLIALFVARSFLSPSGL